MTTILHIIGWWVLLSCTLGPCLSWLFFYGARADRTAAAEQEFPPSSLQ